MSSETNPVKVTAQEPQATQVAVEAIPPQRVEFHIPLVTFIKVFAALLIAVAAPVLWPLLLLVLLAAFLAVTLDALVAWLDAKGVKHWISLLVVIGGLLTVLIVGMVLVIPMLIDQAAAFGQDLPKLREDLLKQFSASGGTHHNIERLLADSNWTEANSWLGHVWSAGGKAVRGISEFVLLIVIAIYLLIDGSKIHEWLLAFFSPLKRAKLRITAQEISKVVFGYVSGQGITSLLVAVYSFVVLSVFHVPGALMLAILAGVFDVLPILGFFIAAAPAFVLALSVSPQTGFIVLGLYLLYQALENYLIAPKVYGKSLRLSTLTVLLGLLVGSLLAGVPGALAALPIIASYEAIERIWLKRFLRDGVAEKHELQKDEEFGEKA